MIKKIVLYSVINIIGLLCHTILKSQFQMDYKPEYETTKPQSTYNLNKGSCLYDINIGNNFLR